MNITTDVMGVADSYWEYSKEGFTEIEGSALLYSDYGDGYTGHSFTLEHLEEAIAQYQAILDVMQGWREEMVSEGQLAG